MTQEMRQLIMFKVSEEINKAIDKIESAKIPVKDEWSDGLIMGMDWAIRILKKDKSAY
jgi:hypothetical protein